MTDLPPKDGEDCPLEELWNEDKSTFLEYWHRCEQVAIHFNDLNARFRLQALAGLALAGTWIGAFKAKDDMDSQTIAGILGSLLLVWLAVCWIDLFYYGRLLRGAVDELLRLEKATSKTVQLSTSIENACKICKGGYRTSRIGRAGFYLFPAIPFSIAALLFLMDGCSSENPATDCSRGMSNETADPSHP